MTEEENQLRARNEDYFDKFRGQFALFPSTLKYSMLKFALGKYIVHCGRINRSNYGLELGISHLVELLELTGLSYHHDTFGILQTVPFVYLELGMTKQAYLFIKTLCESWDELKPLEIIKEADVYEDPSALVLHIRTPVCILSQLMVFKIRLLNETSTAKRDMMMSWYSFLMGCHPRLGENSEISKISGCYPVLERIFHFMFPRGILTDLKQQTLKLMKMVNQANRHVVEAFLNRVTLPIESETVMYNRGTIEEAHFVASAGHHALGDADLSFLKVNKSSLS